MPNNESRFSDYVAEERRC